jgi:protein arginine kinase
MKQRSNRPLPENDVAISSRVRLARNLEAYPFTTRMSCKQGAEILEKVKKVLIDSICTSKHELSFLDMQAIKPWDKQILVDTHLISPEFAQGNVNRAVVISKDERISIMVNEEDHLRLQCIYSGIQLEEAWILCSSIESELNSKLGFAFDKSYGYLTCCPTNVGTGIRASVMLHLPALSMTGYIKGILETCGKIGVAVRGAYGENSEATGNMFQISNQVTLGQTEQEIIAGITNITSQISEQEKMLRMELYKQNPIRFEDRIFRSLGLLQNARVISSEESLKLISDVRLGIIMGLLQGMELEELNELMLMIQPAYLNKLKGEKLKPDERDHKRAEVIREKLNKGLH